MECLFNCLICFSAKRRNVTGSVSVQVSVFLQHSKCQLNVYHIFLIFFWFYFVSLYIWLYVVCGSV
jgi:hypothetical protein